MTNFQQLPLMPRLTPLYTSRVKPDIGIYPQFYSCSKRTNNDSLTLDITEIKFRTLKLWKQRLYNSNYFPQSIAVSKLTVSLVYCTI